MSMSHSMEYYDELVKFEEAYHRALREALAPVRTRFRKEGVEKGFTQYHIDETLDQVDLGDLLVKLPREFPPK